MDHAPRVIQIVMINRHTGVTGGLKQGHHFTDCGGVFHGLNVGTRDHNIFNTRFAQLEDVGQQLALFLREGSISAFAVTSELIFQIFAQ